jgi:hypothetical protein
MLVPPESQHPLASPAYGRAKPQKPVTTQFNAASGCRPDWPACSVRAQNREAECDFRAVSWKMKNLFARPGPEPDVPESAADFRLSR